MQIAKFLEASDYIKDENLYLQKNFHLSRPFEAAYINLRRKENRLYPDDLLKLLPEVQNHPLAKEWIQRERSAKRFANYLAARKIESVLEIGCGNGWLSNYLAKQVGRTVIGTDVNETELRQAARVFNRNNLAFVYADIFSSLFKADSFDIIFIASSIQYFKNLPELLHSALPLLSERGELHILDSPIYKTSEVIAARQRTKAYFESIGYREMSEFYFHHCWEDFSAFNYSIQYNPQSLFNRAIRKFTPLSAFPWVRIVR